MNQNNSFEILMLIKEIYLKAMYKIEGSLSESGLTHQQIMVLKIVGHNKEVNITQLCNELHLSKGTVSGIVNRLEQADYVRKIKYDFDKRNTYVKFSNKGLEFAKVFRVQTQEVFNDLFSEMTKDESDEVINTLKFLKGKIRK
ncbi:MAG: MarR family winged helix-turn-helix transcriptional regulator [Peptostreptococcaceae bacterium]